MLNVSHGFKMATGSHCSPTLRPFEIDGDMEAIDSLSLDFGRYERVNRWKGMPECDEFVGARYKSREISLRNIEIILLLLTLRKLHSEKSISQTQSKMSLLKSIGLLVHSIVITKK